MLKDQTVLVVGANSRVAGEIARLLGENNQLLLLARDRAKLEASLATASYHPVWTGFCDFLDTAQTTALLEQAWEHCGGVDIVIIAHGLLGEQQPTEEDVGLAERVIASNFTCVVSQLIYLANQMERQGKGKIAVITSVAGDRGRPRNYTYGSAKGALGLYLQGLRSRLWGRGVEVYEFKMGPVDTPMTASHHKDFSFAQPAAVAGLMVDLLQSRRYIAYTPGFWRPVMWVVRNLPEWLFQRLSFLSGR